MNDPTTTSIDTAPDIENVRRFWDSNPLWVGESQAGTGSIEFFEEHRRICYEDCFAGVMDERIFPHHNLNARVLDLGCGIGFWLVEFWRRGFRNLSAADLSPVSLDVARKRCALYEVDARFSVENAEATTFDRESFDHVNCQGVIHHTPSTEAALREIAAILKPDGTASVSVYYKNIILEGWRWLRPLSLMIDGLGGRLKGRGRERIFAENNIDDIVRRYDGAKNPIGRAFSVSEFEDMATKYFVIEQCYWHFFPARALPFRLPTRLHRLLDRRLPFMVYFSLRKPSGGSKLPRYVHRH